MAVVESTSDPADLVGAVRAVLAEEDPEGLLALGCPVDEYDPEVPDLVRLVVDGSVTADRVLQVWEKWFEADSVLSGRADALERLTERLGRLRGDSS